MNTAVYTYIGMAVVWTVIALVTLFLAFVIYHTVYTMIKAVDFMRFHKAMSQQNPTWKWKHNLIYTYFGAVCLMWTENGDSVTVRHACGATYKAFNWK